MLAAPRHDTQMTASGGVGLGALVDDPGQPGDLVEAGRVARVDVLRDRVDRAAAPPRDPDPALVLAGPDLRQGLVAERHRRLDVLPLGRVVRLALLVDLAQVL